MEITCKGLYQKNDSVMEKQHREGTEGYSIIGLYLRMQHPGLLKIKNKSFKKTKDTNKTCFHFAENEDVSEQGRQILVFFGFTFSLLSVLVLYECDLFFHSRSDVTS